MHNNGRPSFEMCGIKNASVTVALLWWLAPAAMVNAQQPAPDRPTQPDDVSGSSAASIAAAADQRLGAETICQMVEAAAAAYGFRWSSSLASSGRRAGNADCALAAPPDLYVRRCRKRD